MQVVTARIDIPTRTILKVLLVLAALWFVARIGPVLQQVFAGLLLAMALYPPVARLQRRGLSKGRAVAAVFGAFLAAVALVLGFLIPPMIEEGQEFVDQAPEYLDDGAYWLEDNVPWLYDRLEEWVGGEASDEVASEADAADAGAADAGTGGAVDPGPDDIAPEEITEEVTEGGGPVDAETAISVGQRVGGFIGTAAVAVVLAIYFMSEGERAFSWLSRDLSPRLTRRLRRAAPALSAIISAYVGHQIRTSVLSGIYAFTVLAVLDVPSALILATIVAITDAIPLIGIVMATAPTTVVALTQGWEVALAVFLALIAYQVFENYVLIPRLLGRTFHLSSFGMLVAVLIGWKLAGLVGVLLALPTAAALLVIERVWFEDEEDPDLGGADAPGPVAIAEAVVAVAADALDDGPADAAEEATASPDAQPESPVTPEEAAPAPGPAPGPTSPPRAAGAGKRRRGGRRGQGQPGAAAADPAPS